MSAIVTPSLLSAVLLLTLLCLHAVYANLAEFCAYDAVCPTEVDVPRARYRDTATRE